MYPSLPPDSYFVFKCLANPKSQSLILNVSEINTFSGFISPWTI